MSCFYVLNEMQSISATKKKVVLKILVCQKKIHNVIMYKNICKFLMENLNVTKVYLLIASFCLCQNQTIEAFS